MSSELDDRYQLAISASKEAGQIALDYFPQANRSGPAVERKSDDSPVTIADREAEAHLRRVLSAAFPGDGFLGEEFGDSAGTTGFRWFIDPIDGTRSFIRGIPFWATLVGLQHNGEMVAGMAVEPVFGNVWRALRGQGAFLNDQPIHVSDTPKLGEAILASCDLQFFKKSGTLEPFLGLALECHRQRGYGDYLGFLFVARGSCDLVVDYGVHEWDVAGLKIIIEEAGGKFTDWHGVPAIDRPHVIASNGKLHDAALSHLRGAV